MIFPAPAGFLLMRAEDKITLYDVQQKKSKAELSTPPIKFVVWSSNEKGGSVALVGKDGTITTALFLLVTILITRAFSHYYRQSSTRTTMHYPRNNSHQGNIPNVSC